MQNLLCFVAKVKTYFSTNSIATAENKQKESKNKRENKRYENDGNQHAMLCNKRTWHACMYMCITYGPGPLNVPLYHGGLVLRLCSAYAFSPPPFTLHPISYCKQIIVRIMYGKTRQPEYVHTNVQSNCSSAAQWGM